jgi:glutamine phosphoribosylpyrophosphate amidotransferase
MIIGYPKCLRQLGHTFRTRTDTEVILHAYEEWGQECLDRFNGMFAFAIHDAPRRRLFLARDRFGIKPLHYWHAGGRLIFTSRSTATTTPSARSSRASGRSCRASAPRLTSPPACWPAQGCSRCDGRPGRSEPFS